MKTKLLKKIAVTYELCAGRTLSEGAADTVARMLDQYPEKAVEQALDICVRECKGALSPGDIISRVEQLDGRPSAEEAWAMLPASEDASICWTSEMAEAFGVCRSIIGVDTYGARQAFTSAYKSRVQASRTAGIPVKWELSLGQHQSEREECVRRAMSDGKISEQRALALCPALDMTPRLTSGDATELVSAIAKRMTI